MIIGPQKDQRKRTILPLYSAIGANYAFEIDKRPFKLIHESSRGWIIVPRECQLKKELEDYSNHLLKTRGLTLMPYYGRTSNSAKQSSVDRFIVTPEDNLKYYVHELLDYFECYPVPDMVKPGRVRLKSNIHRAITLQYPDQMPLACINFKILLDKRVCFVSTLSVYKHSQGQGLGSILVSLAIAVSAQYGCNRICLYSSEKGEAMYMKYGFTLYNETMNALEFFIDKPGNLQRLEQALYKHAKFEPGFAKETLLKYQKHIEAQEMLNNTISKIEFAKKLELAHRHLLDELETLEKWVVIPDEFYKELEFPTKHKEVMTDSDQYDDDLSCDSHFSSGSVDLNFDTSASEPESTNSKPLVCDSDPIASETSCDSDSVLAGPRSETEASEDELHTTSAEFLEMIDAIKMLVDPEAKRPSKVCRR